MMTKKGLGQFAMALALVLIQCTAFAQCQLYDFFGNPSNNPYWYSCNGNNFSLNLQSPNTIGAWTINWGDGSPIQSGAGLAPPTAIVHTYAATVDSFLLTFTETATGCTVNGVVIMEQATSASIQVPVGGLTQACAPQTMAFINSSTNTSETTVFTWNFGDGSPIEVYDYTNLGETVYHTYQVGTVDCETVVTLSAENYCNTVQGGPSSATFNPIRIWDIDDAGITASETILCFPDNTVILTNTTERNCLFQGNIYQRFEYWNFGDYWGLGYDSIIDWRAWPPTFPQTLSYPGIGTYTATLLDSNLCGIDVATIVIQIVAPPTANASSNVNTICEDQAVTFTNSSSPNATNFVWNFGDGTPLVFSGAPTLTHVFNNPGSYNVSLIASVGGVGSGCADTTFIPITVLAAPVAQIILDNPAACDMLAVTFTNGSTGAINTWAWNFGNGNTSSLPNPPIQNYLNPGVYNVNLTVTGLNGCIHSDTEIVRVRQSPVANFAVTDVCIGSAGQFTDLSSFAPGQPIISRAWNFGDGFTSNVQNPTHTYAIPGTYTITLTVNTAHCTGSTTRTVNVQAAPVAAYNANTAGGCAPLSVNFTNTSTSAVLYTWLFGDGGASSVQNPNHVFQNFGNADSVYTVSLIARNAFGCTDTIRTDITVHPTAVAQYQQFYTPSCAPAPASFINTSQNATSYIWTFGDGSPAVTDVNPTHVFENTTLFLQTFTVTLVAITPFGCNDTTTTTVSVYPKPDFDFNLTNNTGCSPFTVQFPLVSGAVSYAWNFGDGTISNGGNPSHVYPNNTLLPITYTAQLIATSAFGCSDTATADVTVHPLPITQFSADRISGCGPLTVNFENQSILADSVIWNYGNGQTSDTMAVTHAHTFVNATNATVSYTVSLTAFTDQGCSRTFTRAIQVHPEVTASYTHPLQACSPFSFAFQNTSQNASIYQWDLGNGTVSLAQNPMAGYSNNTALPDTFDIRLISTSVFGCEDTARSTIVVYPKPLAAFVPDNTTGCSPLTVQFQNNSTVADTYQWNYGDGTTATTAAPFHSHTFFSTSLATQTFDVRLVASTNFGCSDTANWSVTVYPDVLANFTPAPEEGCSPLQVSFFNQSFGAGQYFWNFDDGTEGFTSSPTRLFVNLTDTVQDFNVRLIAQSGFGCTDTAYSNIKVFPLPSVDFIVASIDGCYPAEFTFANLTAGATSYAWTYGDGGQSTTADSLHTHVYTNTGTTINEYTVQLTATTTHGCSASDLLEVDVIPEIIANVTPPTGGCSPYTANFVNNSTGAFTYYWDFGDGNFSQDANPIHVYDNPTEDNQAYTVTFVAQSLWGCADTVVFTIPVLGLPDAEFVASPSVQRFPLATIDVVNLSQANPGSAYIWNWGDGTLTTSDNTTTPEGHTYSTWGEYTVILTVGNSICSDSTSQTIRILPPFPIADFIGEGKGCMPLPVSFESTSTYAVSYLWNFGDGNVSNIANPTHAYNQAGTYNVTLTVTGPGGDQDIMVRADIVVVHPRANAFFTVNPPVITIPDQVFFLNLSTNSTISEWDFGDGNTSTDFSPYNFYESLGWHGVTLIANNEFNCPDSFTVDQAVLGNAESRIALPNAFTPSENGPNGGYWTVDDMFNNNVFFPFYKGVEEFKMQIFNKWGELLFESTDVRQGWDGYYRGAICKQDVYVWRVDVKFLDGGKLSDIGDVTLIR